MQLSIKKNKNIFLGIFLGTTCQYVAKQDNRMGIL